MDLRRSWLAATLVCTFGAFAVTIALAPSASVSPTRGLQWLLFVSSSVHVSSTGWFFTLPEVRAYAASRRARYVAVPLALVVGTAVLALLVPPSRFTWLLLGFFAWQFFHFQKQNLGMAALAGVSAGVGSVSLLEPGAGRRRGAGIGGLMVHPRLLQLALDIRLPWAFASCGALNIALIGGLLLNRASHLHGAELAGRAVYGAYLGATMAHFVVDAGLWRLRDAFPRSLLMASVPYLLVPAQPPPQDPAAPDAGPMARATMRPTTSSTNSAEVQRS